MGTLLIGTAGLLSWGFVDATDGDDKHAILDTFSSWFGRGNDREAESLKAIESYDAIEKNEGSGTWLPTYSPTEMPTAGLEEELVVGEAEIVVNDAEESDIGTDVAGSSSGDEDEIKIEIDAKAAKSPTHSPTQLVEEEAEEISYNDTTGEVSSFPFLHKPNGPL